MARDAGLEELIREDLVVRAGLSEKAMFGGWAFLLNGNLLLGAREGSLLVRLGKGNDGWALDLPDIELMVMNGRAMHGWVRAGADAHGDDGLRRRLLGGAIAFVETLPPK
ncbi:TfoX/Sxy family protein [Ensifer sp.]|uniref:TfoX/Sxy family protein n=1 Tax=Ensifer sp. TaxID=1872086 RepID=UPI00289931A7|nr:TfoX/Sxy family protein [Ensifer sp.]